jgi:hypothetical protein
VGTPGTAQATRQSPTQAVVAGQALMAAEAAGADWQVQMLRLIPGGHRQSAENPSPDHTWVVRFSSPSDKEAMAVVHVHDANGIAERG